MHGADDAFEPIHTARLDLIPISATFVEALVDGDRDRASTIIGAVVSRWLAGSPAHVVQLAVAQSVADRSMPPGSARVIVVVGPDRKRRAIGSIGFHGPPDERARLEVECRIHPAYRRRGYVGEAMAAMFEWASGRLGITRFLVAVPSAEAPGPRLLAELELTSRGPSGDRIAWGDRIAQLDAVLDAAT